MGSLTLEKDAPVETLSLWRKTAREIFVVIELLHQHIILVLSVLFALCLLVIVLHISNLKMQMVTAIAFRQADAYTRALNQMRSWYTTEVIARLHSQRAGVSSSQEKELEIPLPAVMSRSLGERLVSGRLGEEVRLLSPYPFGSRSESKEALDVFQQEAWDFLNQNPAKPFFRFEEIDGRKSLRFVTADRMEEACVQCHNELPASPKRDWQVGQVGGMLEVIYPIDSLAAIADMDWKETYIMMGSLILLWVGGFGLVVQKLGRVADELEVEVQNRTFDLNVTNRELELEIAERQMAEETLRQARDNLEKRVQERTAKLAASNAEMIREVAERKRAEEDSRKLNTQLLQRSAQLEASNKELEAFSYSVSHDLRAPLRGIDGFSQAVLEDYEDKLDESGRNYLQRVRAASQRMSQLIDAMLNLARLTRAEVHTNTFDMSEIAQDILGDLRKQEPEREVECVIAPNLLATADPQLMRAVLENLLGNAWKFTRQQPKPRIEFGHGQYKGQAAYFVKDNGAGFDMAYAHKLFGAFQRLHAYTEFSGVGVGLATVHRIIQRHGGQIWAEGAVNEGASFYFTL